MTSDRTTDCARCGKTLQRSYQFCPECGLPASGGSVLSSQIGELRQELTAPPRHGHRPWRRLLVPTASAVMTALVLAVGLLLFNRPLIEVFFPPAEEARAAPLEIAPRWEPQWVLLPAGSFHSGPPFEVSEADLSIYPSAQDNIFYHHITNGDWLEFLTEDEEHLRALGMWEDAIPRYVTGWRRDRSGRPVLPRDPDTGEVLADDLVADIEIDEIRLYRRWVTSSAEYRIFKLGITNERWLEFLTREEVQLRAAGEWESALPGEGSGWRRRATGVPALPHGPVTDILASPLDVLAAAAFGVLTRLPEVQSTPPDGSEDARPGFVVHCARIVGGAGTGDVVHVNELEDRSSLVTGVGVDAVRRFHEWTSRWDFPDAFHMSRYEIRNVLWREFLDDEEATLRERGLWAEAVPGRKGGWVLDEENRYAPPANALDMPVRYVSARAVRAFGDYLTRRLGEPGVEIRMPTPQEWEYAARGSTWNIYPWGDEFPGTPAQGTGDPKTRRGIDENSPLQVDYVDEDVSALGVVALGVNVAEWVEVFSDEDLDKDGRLDRRYPRTEIRGASFNMRAPEAEDRARVWDRTVVEASNAFPYAGVRLVKVRTGE